MARVTASLSIVGDAAVRFAEMLVAGERLARVAYLDGELLLEVVRRQSTGPRIRGV
jgi:hypothetical protein